MLLPFIVCSWEDTPKYLLPLGVWIDWKLLIFTEDSACIWFPTVLDVTLVKFTDVLSKLPSEEVPTARKNFSRDVRGTRRHGMLLRT